MTSDEKSKTVLPSSTDAALVEGVDYTLENGLFVLTRDYLLRRGTCCDSGCRNCPYKKDKLGGDKVKR